MIRSLAAARPVARCAAWRTAASIAGGAPAVRTSTCTIAAVAAAIPARRPVAGTARVTAASPATRAIAVAGRRTVAVDVPATAMTASSVGGGQRRAPGPPHGGPWRQLLGEGCRRSWLETLGPVLHGPHASVERIVRVIACLAEGLGIRGTARVFEVDPNTVLQWLVEAAEQLRAFSRHVLHDVHVRQVQLDELFALLSAVKAGEVSTAEAIERLERSPHWVWVAMDPESKLLLAVDVGARTLALAQHVVHQVTQVLAPDCVPVFLTDGFKESITALRTHVGHWGPPERRQAKGPAPKPRWLPLPLGWLCWRPLRGSTKRRWAKAQIRRTN